MVSRCDKPDPRTMSTSTSSSRTASIAARDPPYPNTPERERVLLGHEPLPESVVATGSVEPFRHLRERVGGIRVRARRARRGARRCGPHRGPVSSSTSRSSAASSTKCGWVSARETGCHSVSMAACWTSTGIDRCAGKRRDMHERHGVTEVMGDDRGRRDRQRQPRHRLEDLDVVDGRAGGVLEAAHPLPRSRHLAADREHGAAIRTRARERGDHVEHARPADPEAHAETAGRPGEPVGHVRRRRPRARPRPCATRRCRSSAP